MNIEWHKFPEEKPTKRGMYYILEDIHDVFAKEYFWSNDDGGVFYRMDFSIVDEKSSMFYWTLKKEIGEKYEY